MEVGFQKGCREMPKTHQGGGLGAEEKRTVTGHRKEGPEPTKKRDGDGTQEVW